MSNVATLNTRIVDDLQALADGWKSVAAELAPAAQPANAAPARKRKRRSRPKA